MRFERGRQKRQGGCEEARSKRGCKKSPMPHAAFCAAPMLAAPRATHRRCGASQSRASATSTQLTRRALLLSGVTLPAALCAEEAVPPITDRARLIPRGLAERLSAQLLELQATTGLRVRVQTVGAGVSGALAYSAAACDVLLVADTRASNMLVTRVADATYARLPRTFFIELPNRFGTKFYVEQHGADGAIAAAIDAIAQCAAPGRLCRSVPGVSSDQLTISLGCAALAGAIAGAAARTDGKRLNVPFLLLFSPIWSIFLISFGLGPVLTRLDSPFHTEPALVALAFIVPALCLWYWIPRGIGPPNDLNA